MEELESRFGDRIRHLGQEHPTGYPLCQALRTLEPPVLVSDARAGRWLRVHCGINVRSRVDNAADLERDWGKRIREHHAGGDVDPGVLANWMLTILGVSLPPRVPQAWLTRDWAWPGKFSSVMPTSKQTWPQGWQTGIPNREIWRDQRNFWHSCVVSWQNDR